MDNQVNKNFITDEVINKKIAESQFVFTYDFGTKEQSKVNYTKLVVLEDQFIITKLYSDENKNIQKLYENEDAILKIKEFFLQIGVSKQLETMSKISNEELQLVDNSTNIVYLKINGNEYKFYKNSNNVEYKKFVEKIIKKVYYFLNIFYTYLNQKYNVSLTAPANWIQLDDEFGNPIIKFPAINISKSETLFKFNNVVSFSPAFLGQYSIEKIGTGTLDEYNKAYNDFLALISNDVNYKILEKENLNIADKIVNRIFIEYKTAIGFIDYIFVENNIICIFCPLTINESYENSLKNENININNRIIKSLKFTRIVKNNSNEVKEKMINQLDKKIDELSKNNITKEQFVEKVKNSDYVFNYTYGSFIPNNEHYSALTLVGDYLAIDENGKIEIIRDKQITDKMWADININLNIIMSCSKETKMLPHIKDSSKDEMTLKLKDRTYLFSNKIDSEKYNKVYKNICEMIIKHYSNDDKLYKSLKGQDHVLIQNWFGKKEITVSEKLITFEKGNLGYVYEYYKGDGFNNLLKNVVKVKKVCRLHPMLLADFRKFLVEELNIFNVNISNDLIMDKGTTISVKLDGKLVDFKNSEEYYNKINEKLNLLLSENNNKFEDIEKIIKSADAS